MKQLNAQIGKIIFYVFVLAVFGWTASLTLGEMKAILPNDPITPYFALALFDSGALAWLMAWVGHARGLMQRAISAIMLVVCLAGVVLLSAGRLMDGGQTMVTVSTSLSAAVVYGVIGATLANLAAIYAFHVSDPDTMEEIETGLLSDTLRAEAQKQATASIESQAKELGAILAARATGQLKYNLRLPMGTAEVAQKDNFIDATARDVETQPKQKTPGLLEIWMKAAADKFKPSPVTITQPAKVYQSVATAPIKNDQSEEPIKSYLKPIKDQNTSRFIDAEIGELTIKEVRESGLCECPPAVFAPNPSEELQDMVQAKGGMPCRSAGEFITWAGSKRTCERCAFFKSAPNQSEALHYHPMKKLQPMTEPEPAKGDSVFTGGVAGSE